MSSAPEPRTTILRTLALLILLLTAGYFRFTGLTWGDYQYQHPDERFLIWVVADIAPVDSPAEYFDTAASTLNPVNRGHGFYVYGDFPVIATRYVTEALFEQVGWQQILQVGRGLSALLDLFSVLLVYLITERLLGWRAATLSGLLSGAAVLQIQQAHFFTSDSFAVFFTTLALYLGVLIASAPLESGYRWSRRIMQLSLLYGAAVGMAMACKINTAPVAVLLPLALGLYYLRQGGWRLPSWVELARLAAYAAAGGVVAFLVFRVAMPYAFSGPGFFGLVPDPSWLKSMQDLRAQSMGDVDFPPALQWARRSHLFSLKNMVLWGLGPALGIAGWVGFLAFAWQIFSHFRVANEKRTPPAASLGQISIPPQASFEGISAALPAIAQIDETEPDPLAEPEAHVIWLEQRMQHAAASLAGSTAVVRPSFNRLGAVEAGAFILWFWTGAYFLWQSMAWNPTMRYQLPIYPTLAIFAAWGLTCFWRKTRVRAERSSGAAQPRSLLQTAVLLAGVLVVGLTLAWAFAFTRIYNRAEPRYAASQWIFENVPGPVNLEGQSAGQPWKLLLPLNRQTLLRADTPYRTQFVYASPNPAALDGLNPDSPDQISAVASVLLPTLHVQDQSGANARLAVRVYPAGDPASVAAEGFMPLPPGGRSLDPQTVTLSALHSLRPGTRYTLELALEAPAGGPAPAAINGPLVVQMDGQISASLYRQSRSISYQSGADGFMEIALTEGGTLRQLRYTGSDSLPVGPLSVLVVDSTTEQTATATATVNAAAIGDPGTASTPSQTLPLDVPLSFESGKTYRLALLNAYTGQPLELASYALDFLDQPQAQWFPQLAPASRPDDPLWLVFSSGQPATLTQVTLGHASQLESAAPSELRLEISSQRNASQTLATGSAVLPGAAGAGGPLTFILDRPLELAPNESYNLIVTPTQGSLYVSGASPANESTWDMALPFRVDQYDPYGGYYRGDLTLEMYWDDTPEKYDRFVNILDQAGYIFFSSNRQWGTTTRIPERYPLTTRFYADLLGCPAEMEVINCYNLAEVGTYQGRLGFELVKVVTSYPNLGSFEINDQFAEEAFTVYDHSKVMIFKKSANYDPAVTRALLGEVDLDSVVHLTPRKAGEWRDLLLPANLLARQQAGGTFAALFPPQGLLNRFPWLGAVVYYLFLFALGAVTYPALRLALPGLADRAYPLARTAGMVAFAYLAWLPGSLGITVTRGLLLAAFLALALSGLLLAWFQRSRIRQRMAENGRSALGYFASVEALALLLFILGLLLRLGNPDLWHPIFGGEKPMDFSYFNAVLKSSVFPPYDPWFAGGYINYYYYGFVLVGMPIKLLGITPSVAYNLIIPALFMLTGLGAFSVVYNLKAHGDETALPPGSAARPWRKSAFVAGLAAVVALMIIGNLGIPRMYWQGLQKLVVPDEQIAQGTLIERASWAAQGLGKMLRGEADRLPFYPSDWYWKPSRAIQPESGLEITEFPFFTFLYGDLHAHLIALPVTILAIGWALGVWLGRRSFTPPSLQGKGGTGVPGAGGIGLALAILFGALVSGALRPANTWDQYTFLALSAVALFAARFWDGTVAGLSLPRRALRAVLPVLALVGLALLMYYPFNYWFQQGYNTIEPWRGPKTNLASYLSHWGLFLFIIVGWLFDETVDWMAATPLSALGRLRAYQSTLLLAAGAVVVGVLGLALSGVTVALIAAPLGIWVTLLLFRPGQSNAKRAVLFVIGTALLLTLAVELVAVRGDNGRMNSVFKFYYQAWTMLSLSATAALAWLMPRLLRQPSWSAWKPNARGVWLAGLGLLLFSAALYPLHALPPKFEDRMAPDAPRALDGMTYMQYARYTDGLTAETLREMDLSQDYAAIRWMQANISGSPVIVEANTPEYRHWGTRYTIYTGLPGVVGWNYHQRQQRILTPDTWVWDRIFEIEAFYRTTSPEQSAAFLKKYGVQYIIFGQLERILYPGPGLDKFQQLDGQLWQKVYEQGETVIYKRLGD